MDNSSESELDVLMDAIRQHPDNFDGVHRALAAEVDRLGALAGEQPNLEPKTLPKYEDRGMARPSDEQWQPGARVCPCGCPTRSAHLRMLGVI
jgi:hypothetical protein